VNSTLKTIELLKKLQAAAAEWAHRRKYGIVREARTVYAVFHAPDGTKKRRYYWNRETAERELAPCRAITVTKISDIDETILEHVLETGRRKYPVTSCPFTIGPPYAECMYCPELRRKWRA
jgi:hypothetical protein